MYSIPNVLYTRRKFRYFLFGSFFVLGVLDKIRTNSTNPYMFRMKTFFFFSDMNVHYMKKFWARYTFFDLRDLYEEKKQG